jgi:hypothetical protein
MIYKTQELSGMMLDRACAMFDPFVDELRWEFKGDHYVGFAAPDQDGDEEIVMVICDAKISTSVRTLAIYKLYSASEQYTPSTNWAQCGWIIERERLELRNTTLGGWNSMGDRCVCDGPTARVAAMRAYVASKAGETIELDGAA